MYKSSQKMHECKILKSNTFCSWAYDLNFVEVIEISISNINYDEYTTGGKYLKDKNSKIIHKMF